MGSRLPNDNEEETNAAAAAAFQTALAQQVRPLLGGWDPVTAMATMHRNLLQQQQQQNSASINQSTTAAVAAAAAAGLSTPTSLSTLPPALWPYAAALQAPGLQPPTPNGASAPANSQAAMVAAAASLASLGPATGYLNHLQNLHNPESLMSFQQNLLLLEQFQQQRQLLSANPHLLMAATAAAAHSSNPSASSSPQSLQHNHLNHQQHLNHLLAQTNPAQFLQHHHQQQQAQQHSNSPLQQNGSNNHSSNNSSLLTTVNSNSIFPALTNQHQDSLVDQHFRRSLGEDYNQIMASKASDKINVGK